MGPFVVHNYLHLFESLLIFFDGGGFQVAQLIVWGRNLDELKSNVQFRVDNWTSGTVQVGEFHEVWWILDKTILYHLIASSSVSQSQLTLDQYSAITHETPWKWSKKRMRQWRKDNIVDDQPVK